MSVERRFTGRARPASQKVAIERPQRRAVGQRDLGGDDGVLAAALLVPVGHGPRDGELHAGRGPAVGDDPLGGLEQGPVHDGLDREDR